MISRELYPATGTASMRPWRFATDNAEGLRRFKTSYGASMRPWRFATDNPLVAPNDAVLGFMLQ